jgi:hypothetical protein
MWDKRIAEIKTVLKVNIPYLVNLEMCKINMSGLFQGSMGLT